MQLWKNAVDYPANVDSSLERALVYRLAARNLWINRYSEVPDYYSLLPLLTPKQCRSIEFTKALDFLAKTSSHRQIVAKAVVAVKPGMKIADSNIHTIRFLSLKGLLIAILRGSSESKLYYKTSILTALLSEIQKKISARTNQETRCNTRHYR